MILRAAAGSDGGRRRPVHEDPYAVAADIGLDLGADGLGGHVAGQVASELAAEAALRTVRTLEGAAPSLAEKLRYAVTAANREVHETARRRPELQGMGTTLVALLAQEGRAALAHVGDSRAYLVRGERIRQLTDDHSLVGELLRRREISPDAAREHPQRHVLTRAVGVRPQVEPDLAGHVRDEEIARAVGGGVDPQEGVDSLIRLANSRGGEDNITVVVVRCEKSADPE